MKLDKCLSKGIYKYLQVVKPSVFFEMLDRIILPGSTAVSVPHNPAPGRGPGSPSLLVMKRLVTTGLVIAIFIHLKTIFK